MPASAARLALVWDLDGTLAETWQDLATALNHAYRDFAYPLVAATTVRGWIGDGAETMVAQGMPVEERNIARLAQVVRRFREYYADCCVAETRLYAGVDAALDGLSAHPAAVASNKPERFVKQILATLGVAHHFSVIVGGDTLSVRKPDAAVLRHVATTLGLPAKKLWMVGDTPTDVHAARAVGARAIGVTWGYRSRAELEGAAPDAIVDTAVELVESFGGA